jgi:hypothetical protein
VETQARSFTFGTVGGGASALRFIESGAVDVSLSPGGWYCSTIRFA